jgi:hypothetical protein
MQYFRRQNNRSRNVLAVIISASILAFVFTVYFNMHVHILPDGRIVAHSHALPQTDPSGNSHQHTNLELIVLNQFSGLKSLLAGAVFLFITTLFLAALFCIYFSPVTQVEYAPFSRRAPPLTI